MKRAVINAVGIAVFALGAVVALAEPAPLKRIDAAGPNATAQKDEEKAPIGSNLTREQKRSLMLIHSRIRADVGVARLTWSAELAAFAQEWADQLAAASCTPKHRPASGQWRQRYGENIYMGMTSSSPETDAMETWESEKQYFKGQPLSTSDLRAIHYTQIVWKTTTQVGCAVVECEDNVVVVCNYAPAGNTIGQKPF
jgi:pathogenesis-related protein 1